MILSHTWQVAQHRDAQRLEMIRRAEPGTYQDGWAAKRTRRQNDEIGPDQFGGTVQEDADGTSTFKHHAISKDAATDGEIGSTTRGGKIRKHRALPNTSDHISWQHSSADSPWRIKICNAMIAEGRTGLQESAMLREKSLSSIAPNRKRAVSTVPTVVKVGIVFNATKKGEYFGKRPARIAARCPFIIVVRWLHAML